MFKLSMSSCFDYKTLYILEVSIIKTDHEQHKISESTPYKQWIWNYQMPCPKQNEEIKSDNIMLCGVGNVDVTKILICAKIEFTIKISGNISQSTYTQCASSYAK